MSARAVTVAIIGAGLRATGYARYALKHPERMRIVAIAEPNPVRRQAVGDEHSVPASMRFESYEDLLSREQLADAVINGTMDHLHHASSMPLLQRGYHMLLEKPIARSEAHVRELIAAARQHRRTVMICHVLRYAPFYAKLKQLVTAKTIGDIVSMHTSENVAYHHMATSFIRGRWNSRERSSPMLLQKCCHDMDIIAWLLSGVQPVRVASFGSLTHFRRENAPPGSALRCLDGCEIESTCQYSARAIHITQKLHQGYAWESIEHLSNPTEKDKLRSLRTDNPYGRCVWHCDNDVVDRQTVIVEFANGVTVSHDMFCATARATRNIHLVGTLGEIEGDMEAAELRVRRPQRVAGQPFSEELIRTDAGSDGHGGGDERLIADFISVLRGDAASAGATRIEDSLAGHLIAFAADRSMLERRVIELTPDGA